MTANTLKILAAKRLALKLEADRIASELKEINAALVAEAVSRPEEHEPLPDGDGTAWVFAGEECELRVVFPTDSLKELIKIDSKVCVELAHLVPDMFSLFDPVEGWRPMPNIRELANDLFAVPVARKIVKLCTTVTSPKVLVKALAPAGAKEVA